MSSPFFSVVVPTRSRVEQLAVCIRKLAELAYPRERYEVIVVDDGSEHPLVVEPPSELRFRLIRGSHQGPAAARNLGAASAEGDYLAFVDDDCEPERNWLRAFANRIARVPEAAFGGRTVNGLPENTWSTASELLLAYVHSYYRNGGTSQPGFFASNNFALSALLFRQLGGFSTRFTLAAGEDRELCARVIEHGLSLEYVPGAVVRHAHPLDLHSFLRQHFNYGRGAFAFHQIQRTSRAHSLRFEPAGFYLRLVTYPFAVAPEKPPLRLSALLVLSQLASAGGFFREALAHRVSAAKGVE
jgi:GT2 family glycosyltransferase